jgi:hypothetical protein
MVDIWDRRGRWEAMGRWAYVSVSVQFDFVQVR